MKTYMYNLMIMEIERIQFASVFSNTDGLYLFIWLAYMVCIWYKYEWEKIAWFSFIITCRYRLIYTTFAFFSDIWYTNI